MRHTNSENALIRLCIQSLRETLKEVIPAKQEQLKKLVSPLRLLTVSPNVDSIVQKAEHSQTIVGDVKVRYTKRTCVAAFSKLETGRKHHWWHARLEGDALGSVCPRSH